MSDHDLVERARRARDEAYAPYSGYRVGAALLTTDGTVFIGANVENASYGLTVCAERVAVTHAVVAGHRAFAALAVATEDGGTPCGACRQVLREFALELPIHIAAAQGPHRTTDLKDLLPDAFGR